MPSTRVNVRVNQRFNTSSPLQKLRGASGLVSLVTFHPAGAGKASRSAVKTRTAVSFSYSVASRAPLGQSADATVVSEIQNAVNRVSIRRMKSVGFFGVSGIWILMHPLLSVQVPRISATFSDRGPQAALSAALGNDGAKTRTRDG